MIRFLAVLVLVLGGCGLFGSKRRSESEKMVAAANGPPAGTQCPTTPIAPGVARIEGRTLTTQKTAVAGVKVTAAVPGGDRQETRSDEHGRYAFASLPAGYYNLVAYYEFLSASRGCIVAAGGGTASADIVVH